MESIIKLRTNLAPTAANLERIKRGVPKAIGRAVSQTALWTMQALIKNTPKRWTGMTRRSWRKEERGPAHWRVFNESKVMLFLEEGTKDHGPVTATTSRPWANDKRNMRYGMERVARGKSFRAKKLFIPLTRRAMFGWNPGLRYGIDYVLKAHVRGIRARRIVATQRGFTNYYLNNQAFLNLNALLNP